MYSIRVVLSTIFIICWLALVVFSMSVLPTSRTTKSRKTSIDKVPYLVQLRDANVGSAPFCAGTLVAPKYVLTAAHCFMNRPKEHVRIVGGTNTRRGPGVERRIAFITIRPGYSIDTYDSDIAVVELDIEMPLDTSYIDILPLCTKLLNPGDLVDIFGWGHTVNLRTASLTVKDWGACSDEFGILEEETMFCAGGGLEAKVSCIGDSGGPVVHAGQLCGIVSARKCEPGTRPSAYTDVFAVRSFIESVIPELFVVIKF